MSPKQAIYLKIVRHSIYISRNFLQNVSYGWWKMPPWRCLGLDTASYALIQLIHKILVNGLNPEFADADVDFINDHVRVFYGMKGREIKFPQGVLAPTVRSLIELVPEELAHKVSWRGPN